MYYPKLKERPPNFRINRGVGHPLAKGCTLAMLGRFPGTATANDSSDYKNDGALIGMDPPTDWLYQPELGRWAVETNGSSQYVDFGDKPIWYLSEYTWCGWFRGVSDAVRGSSKQPLINGTDRFTFSWDHGSSVFVKSLTHLSVDNNYYPAQFTSDLLAHTWYHVCGTYDGSYLRAWLNGLNEATVSAPPPASSTGKLFISRPKSPWPGRTADVFGFNRALSASEISALADPDNVDLRMGGVPLILPPKRAWWPATVITTTSTKKRTFSQRTFNIRTFYQRTLSGPELQPQSGNVYISSLLSNSNIAVPEIKRSASISPTPAGISTFSSTPEIKRSTVIPTDPLEILTAPSIPTIKSSSIVNATGLDQKLLPQLLHISSGYTINITSIPLLNILPANLEIKRSASIPLTGLNQRIVIVSSEIISGSKVDLSSFFLLDALSADLEIKSSSVVVMIALQDNLYIIPVDVARKRFDASVFAKTVMPSLNI